MKWYILGQSSLLSTIIVYRQYGYVIGIIAGIVAVCGYARNHVCPVMRMSANDLTTPQYAMLHVTPIDDTREHQVESTCGCCPRLEMADGEMIFIHNAYDGRTDQEPVPQSKPVPHGLYTVEVGMTTQGAQTIAHSLSWQDALDLADSTMNLMAGNWKPMYQCRGRHMYQLGELDTDIIDNTPHVFINPMF